MKQKKKRENAFFRSLTRLCLLQIEGYYDHRARHLAANVTINGVGTGFIQSNMETLLIIQVEISAAQGIIHISLVDSEFQATHDVQPNFGDRHTTNEKLEALWKRKKKDAVAHEYLIAGSS
jgi:hypothetical protein